MIFTRRIAAALAVLAWAFAGVAVATPVVDRTVCSTADKGGPGTCLGQVVIDSATQEINKLYDIAPQVLVSVSGADTISACTSPAITSYVDGQQFRFKPASNSLTGGDTLNLCTIGSKPLVSAGGVALAAGDLQSSNVYLLTYLQSTDQFRLETVPGLGAASLGSNTFSGNQTISANTPFFYGNALASGQQSGLSGEVAGLQRWVVYTNDGTAESGANSGSNFAIGRFSDAASFLSNVLTANRATGTVNLAVPPTLAGIAVNTPNGLLKANGTTTNIPFSSGTNGLGFTNSSFAINYAPAAEAGSDALEILRTDTWTGGTHGNVTGTVYAYMTAPAGRTTFSWTTIAAMNNNGTIGDNSENVATYAKTLKNSTGRSWAATAQVIDTTGNADPVGQTVAEEFDVNADGTDANGNRVAVDAHFISQNGLVNSYGTAAFKASTNSSKAFWIYGLDCHTAQISSACVALADGQAIELSTTAGGRTITHNTNQWQFNNNSLSTTPLIITDAGVLKVTTVQPSGLTASSAVATDASKNLISVTNTGSGNNVLATGPAIVGGTHTALTGLGIRSTGAAFDLTLASTEVFTAGHTLTVTLGNTDRTLTMTGNASISGTNTGDQTITLTGDVGGSGTGSFAATIANQAVTYAKIQNISATARVLGRKTAGAGSTEELAASDINTIINSTVAPVFANISSKPTTLSGYGISDGQPLDSDLTTIAALTATTDGFMQSKSSAWSVRTPTQVTADLIACVGDSGSGGTKGMVPAPGVGDTAAGKYLRADCTWQVPPGGGGSSRPLLASARTYYVGASLPTPTISIASPAVVTSTAHGLSANDPVVFAVPQNTTAATISAANPAVVTMTNTFAAGQPVVFASTGSLPEPLVAGTTYYVIAAGLSGSQFEVSATVGGAAISTAAPTATFTNGSANIGITNANTYLKVGQLVRFANSGGALPTNFAAATDYYVVSASSTLITVSATNGGSAITAGSAGTGTQTVAQQGTHYVSSTGALPTGITEGTTYYVISAGLAANTFEVSTSPGGAAVNTTGSVTGSPIYNAYTGNDTNTGLAQTRAGALLTIQQAVTNAASVDTGVYNVTVQIADGTYTAPVVLKNMIGSGTYKIQGNSTYQSNVLVSTTSADAFNANGIYTPWYLESMKLVTTTGGNGLSASNGATINFQKIDFGTTAATFWAQTFASSNGHINAYGNYTISGTGNAHWHADYGATVNVVGYTVTLLNTPAFAGSFAQGVGLGLLPVNGDTFVGSATGVRYSSTLNALVNSNGAGANYLPGNSAGTTGTGGLYGWLEPANDNQPLQMAA